MAYACQTIVWVGFLLEHLPILYRDPGSKLLPGLRLYVSLWQPEKVSHFALLLQSNFAKVLAKGQNPFARTRIQWIHASKRHPQDASKEAGNFD